MSPKLKLTTLDKIPRLLLEHRVLVGDGDELIIAEALSVCNVSQIRVALLAELSNNKRLVELRRSVSIVYRE